MAIIDNRQAHARDLLQRADQMRDASAGDAEMGPGHFGDVAKAICYLATSIRIVGYEIAAAIRDPDVTREES